jgi:hypothetical protein
MRYILNNENYIEEISFSNEIECNNKTCTEYMGIVPTGYSSLLEWSEIAVIQAYKVVGGNLTHDPNKETDLLNEWAIQESRNKPEVIGNKVTSINENSTDIQYPSAKCLYRTISSLDIPDVQSLSNTEIENLINNIVL